MLPTRAPLSAEQRIEKRLEEIAPQLTKRALDGMSNSDDMKARREQARDLHIAGMVDQDNRRIKTSPYGARPKSKRQGVTLTELFEKGKDSKPRIARTSTW